MPDIRLTALSNSLAKTYGVIRVEGDSRVLKGEAGDVQLICGQCGYVLGESLPGLPNFRNAAAVCPGCAVTVHLTRPSRYCQPVAMKRNLKDEGRPLDIFHHPSSLHKGLECEKLITETSGKLLNQFVEQQGHRPRIFYHYTSGAGLAGIVSTGTLWATDIAYMNDTSELQYAINLVSEEIKNIDTSNPLVVELLRRASHLTEPTNASLGYCAACFCTNADLLSQWRAYGDAGKGFALGFDAYEFSGDHHRVRKVIYDQDVQRQLIRSSINEFVSAFEKVSCGESRVSLDQKKILPAFSAAIASLLAEYILAFKHPAFSEEGEWRLIIEYNRDEHLPFIKFRNSKDLTIPYLAVGFSAQRDESGLLIKPPLPLIEIVQGPSLHPERNLKATHLFLEQNGFEHVEVAASQTPLRS